MLKVVIIEDEVMSADMLQALLNEHFPDVQIKQTCASANEGIKAIKKHQPDLVFLDVELPTMTGFDLLKKIGEASFDVIFTTSHEEYSIQAIRSSAIDYLMKPLDLDELKEAMERVTKKRNTKPVVADTAFRKLPHRIALPMGEGLVFVEMKDIIHCDSDRNYTQLFMSSGEKYLVTRTLKDVEEVLDGNYFFRIHHSFLINMNHIKKYVRGAGGYVVMTDNSSLSVARNRKEEFLQNFSRL